MTIRVQNQRTCNKGHIYFKSSDCPVCPICEQLLKPKVGFLSMISTPARRALVQHEIISLDLLSTYRESELLGMHGIGPTVILKLATLLKEAGLKFKK